MASQIVHSIPLLWFVCILESGDPLDQAGSLHIGLCLLENRSTDAMHRLLAEVLFPGPGQELYAHLRICYRAIYKGCRQAHATLATWDIFLGVSSHYWEVFHGHFLQAGSSLLWAKWKGGGDTSPGVLAMLGRAQDWAPPFFHLTGHIGGSPNIFMLLLSLCQQLWAPQKYQGLGSTVPAWEIHRVNRPQVSQREMRMRISFWCLGDESMVGVVGHGCKNLFLELWSVVRSISGLWWWFLEVGLLSLGVHWENVLCKGSRAILKVRGWRLKTEVLMTS